MSETSVRPFALIADDDPMQGKLMSYALKKMGIDSEITRNSRDFLARLRELEPHLCFIDLNMETLGAGFSVISAVRNVLGPNPTLFIVSAVSDRAAIAHGLEIGANDYIIKPVDFELLASKVSHYIHTEKLDEEGDRKIFPIPVAGVPVNFSLDLEIQEIDEFGARLLGRHLLSKGTVVAISGDHIQAFSGRAEPLTLTVISTWVESPGKYGASAEFDRTDLKLLIHLRRWLSENKSV